METIYSEISIETQVSAGYDTMLYKATFDQWTSVISPSPCYEGNWTEEDIIRRRGYQNFI